MNTLTSRKKTCLLPDLMPVLFHWSREYSSKSHHYHTRDSQFSSKNINDKKSVTRIFESEIFTKDIFEITEIENLKTEIISPLETTVSIFFQKELNTLKDKCEKLKQNSYSNYKDQINKLRKEIANKDEFISELSATLNSFTNNLALKA